MPKEEPVAVQVQEAGPAPLPAVQSSGACSPADTGGSTCSPNPSAKSEATPPPTKQQQEELLAIPSYSRWFDWHSIHECEARLLPEFFDGTSSKNPNLYKYYRNSIIERFRSAVLSSFSSGSGSTIKKITFTEVRRTLVGDVGCIRRVFDFLESWGLINYSPSSHPTPLLSSTKQHPTPPTHLSTDATGNSADSATSSAKKLCSGCKSLCSIACFVCDKYDLVLCARCYVRGNYRVGVNCSEFRRVEISETSKTDWTDKETLQLLEALMHYGDDWMRVAEHVGSRTEKECVNRFVKLPFGEKYDPEPTSLVEEDGMSIEGHGGGGSGDVTSYPAMIESLAKRRRLTPLADASNPIMAQAAFLSALAGSEVAEAAASAAVASLIDVDCRTAGTSHGPSIKSDSIIGNEVDASGKPQVPHALAELGVGSMLKEEYDMDQVISNITEVQMKEIQDKVAMYEAMELQLEKERRLLDQMKHQLFLDHLDLLFRKDRTTAATKFGLNAEKEPVRT